MIEIKAPQDLKRLRRIALDAQGLLQTQARGLSGAREMIEHLGHVQIDTISVVERAHHHVLYARVLNFKPEMINQMLLDRHIFEYWAHAAAFLPIDDFRFSLLYKQALKNGQTHWYKNPDRKLMKELLAKIRAEGPLRSRDVESATKKGGGWWDWKPAKKALEQLYMEGDLMVSCREGFQKVYDLSERVLPAHVDTQVPTMAAFAEHVLNKQLRCHGLVSLKGLTYHQSGTVELRKVVKALVDEGLANKRLEQVKLSSGEVFILRAGSLERHLPRLNHRFSILSPFDNCVIQRERLKALFHYDYQLECYVPEAKRQYGYFCLPLLYRGEFMGRMDCKAHRKDKRLEIKSLYWEPHNFDQDRLMAEFVKAVAKFCAFQDCESVCLQNVQPKKSAKSLRRALQSLA